MSGIVIITHPVHRYPPVSVDKLGDWVESLEPGVRFDPAEFYPAVQVEVRADLYREVGFVDWPAAGLILDDKSRCGNRVEWLLMRRNIAACTSDAWLRWLFDVECRKALAEVHRYA